MRHMPLLLATVLSTFVFNAPSAFGQLPLQTPSFPITLTILPGQVTSGLPITFTSTVKIDHTATMPPVSYYIVVRTPIW